MKSPLQLKVGLITDIHYDGSAGAMNRLYEAVAALRRGDADAVIVMGDLVNGDSAPHAKRLLREVSALCESFRGTIYYMPGNHDLDHLSKAEFYDALGRGDASPFFDIRVGDYRLMSLDGNFSPDGTEYERGNFDWQQAFVPQEQLNLLRKRMGEQDAPVVLFSHQRLDQASKFAVQNDVAVREMIAASGKVKAVFQGHQHADDLKRIDGTAYYTLSAHTDDAGPAMLFFDTDDIRIIRDFQP